MLIPTLERLDDFLRTMEVCKMNPRATARLFARGLIVCMKGNSREMSVQYRIYFRKEVIRRLGENYYLRVLLPTLYVQH